MSQTVKSANLLFLNRETIKTKDHVTAISPKGFAEDIYYTNVGSRNGKDYQTLALNAVQGAIQYKTKSPSYTLDTSSSGNPADTFLGDSAARNVNFQALVDAENPGAISDLFAEVTHLNRGWMISKKKAMKIIENFNKLFLPKSAQKTADPSNKLFHAELLTDTDKIELYAIQLDVRIYKDGLLRLASMPSETLKNYLDKNGIFHILGEKSDLVIKHQQDFAKALQNGDPDAITDYGADLIYLLERHLPGERLVDLLGLDNVFVQIHVSGFRTNDEEGMNAVASNSEGLVGSSQAGGPLASISRQLKISNGEFYLYWMINQL